MPTAPHAVLLVLDATVGQNALSQVEIFGKIAGVTGLVMTKLDGTARGGILVAIAAKFGLPVHFIGVGEGVDDLAPFTARDFARADRRDRCRLTRQHDDARTSAMADKPTKPQLNPDPQARARSRAAGAVLRRQFAASAFSPRPAAFMVAVLVALAVSYALTRHIADHAGGHRGHRAGVRRADADPARRPVHQAQADHHLCAVRRHAARRARLRQAAARHRVRLRCSISPTKAGAS